MTAIGGHIVNREGQRGKNVLGLAAGTYTLYKVVDDGHWRPYCKIEKASKVKLSRAGGRLVYSIQITVLASGRPRTVISKN